MLRAEAEVGDKDVVRLSVRESRREKRGRRGKRERREGRKKVGRKERLRTRKEGGFGESRGKSYSGSVHVNMGEGWKERHALQHSARPATAVLVGPEAPRTTAAADRQGAPHFCDQLGRCFDWHPPLTQREMGTLLV